MNMHTPDVTAAALEYANAGLPIFPCGADKAPLVPGGFKSASADAAQVAEWWRRWPSALIGLPTGEASGLFVIDADIDRDTGEAVGEATLAAIGAPVAHAPRVRTRSGGVHYYFRWAEGLASSAGKLGAKVDTRGAGGYVIAAGSPGYAFDEWDTADTLRRNAPDVPPELVARLRSHGGAGGFKFDTGGHGDRDEAERLIAMVEASPNTLDHGDWVKLALALKHAVGDRGRAAWLAFSARWAGPQKPGRAEEAWDTAKPTGAAGGGSVVYLLGKPGYQAPPRGRRGARAVPPTHMQPDLDLVRDNAGRPIWCAANAVEIIDRHEDWRGAVAFDEFDGRHMLMRPVPGGRKAKFEARPLTDADLTAAQVWFNRNGFPTATRNVVTDAVYAVAAQTTFNPVAVYLDALTWDRRERIGDWLATYCGAESTLFTREAGRRWLISAVARALAPGCKVDALIVMEGAQGVGKSTALRTLTGEAWFGDALPDMAQKDASSYLRGKWIVEIAELTAVRRAEIEQVKAFISRQEERFRPAYGRAEVFEPRRCVFAGTTNRADYLRDESGNRRFWPVKVGAVDVAALAADRDQLWAEAVAAYRAGERWWLTGEAEAQAIEAQGTRQEDDPWAAAVVGYVAGRAEVSTREVLAEVFSMTPAGMTRGDAHRVGGLLRRLGFEPDGKFKSGANKDLTRYRRC